MTYQELVKLQSRHTTLYNTEHPSNIHIFWFSEDTRTWNRHKPVQHSKSIPSCLTSEEPRRRYYYKGSEAGEDGTASRCLGLLSLLRSFKQMQGIFTVPCEKLPLEGFKMFSVLRVLFLSPEGAVSPRLQAPVDCENRGQYLELVPD